MLKMRMERSSLAHKRCLRSLPARVIGSGAVAWEKDASCDVVVFVCVFPLSPTATAAEPWRRARLNKNRTQQLNVARWQPVFANGPAAVRHEIQYHRIVLA